MIVSFPARGIGAAAIAAGLLMAGCASDSDAPKTTASPAGGTQVSTDAGAGESSPGANTTQRPTTTIQELALAPDGLASAPGGTQYGEALVGGPSSTAEPPPPPPPPEPEQAELPPAPEAEGEPQTSDGSSASAAEAEPAPEPTPKPTTSASTEPIAIPEVVEPEPMEPAAAAEPAAPAPEGQTIHGTMPTAQYGEPETVEPEPAAEPTDPVAAEPEPAAEPTEPVVAEAPPPVTPPTPEPEAQPVQPAPAPAMTQTPPVAEQQQARLPAGAPGSNTPALASEAYGVGYPQSGQVPSQGGTAIATAPAQSSHGVEPIGLIYFREGSFELSQDDRSVLAQIAEYQRANGGIIDVVGYASTGTEQQEANQRISEARANAVAHELLSYGVPQSALRAAVGDSQPVSSEAMPSGAGNRRVEVYLTAY